MPRPARSAWISLSPSRSAGARPHRCSPVSLGPALLQASAARDRSIRANCFDAISRGDARRWGHPHLVAFGQARTGHPTRQFLLSLLSIVVVYRCCLFPSGCKLVDVNYRGFDCIRRQFLCRMRHEGEIHAEASIPSPNSRSLRPGDRAGLRAPGDGPRRGAAAGRTRAGGFPTWRAIAIEPFEALSSHAMRELDDEALGWFSRRLPWGSYGMLLRASLTAPMLEVALRRWCRHHGLLTEDVRINLGVEDAAGVVGIRELVDLGALREFCLVSLLRNLHGIACWLADSRIALIGAASPSPRRRTPRPTVGSSAARSRSTPPRPSCASTRSTCGCRWSATTPHSAGCCRSRSR